MEHPDTPASHRSQRAPSSIKKQHRAAKKRNHAVLGLRPIVIRLNESLAQTIRERITNGRDTSTWQKRHYGLAAYLAAKLIIKEHGPTMSHHAAFVTNVEQLIEKNQSIEAFEMIADALAEGIADRHKSIAAGLLVRMQSIDN